MIIYSGEGKGTKQEGSKSSFSEGGCGVKVNNAEGLR